jgi:hypothetical protein
MQITPDNMQIRSKFSLEIDMDPIFPMIRPDLFYYLFLELFLSDIWRGEREKIKIKLYFPLHQIFRAEDENKIKIDFENKFLWVILVH